jgi:lipoprotein NlpI
MCASLLLACLLPAPNLNGEPPSVAELLEQARAALKATKTDRAYALANEAVKRDGKRPDAYFVRGTVLESQRKHVEAIADFDRAIALDPKAAEAYNHRGSEHLKRADFDLAIKDFDRFLELKPEEEPGHWRRGIAYYYAGKHDLGRKQFANYLKVDKNDVENAVWHFLCAAKISGVDAARKDMISVGNDRRIPMAYIHALFRGQAKPEHVLNAVKQGNPTAEELTERSFYAHLYVSLYYYALGVRKLALEHINKAADDYKIGHYMYDIALVHRDRIRKELEH